VTGANALFHAVPLQQPFTPGVFARATWRLHTAVAPRAAAQLASDWLSGLRLPHTLRRDGEDWRIDLAPAAAKKKCVFSLSVEPLGSTGTPAPVSAPGATLTVAFSPKATLRDLLARLPPLSGHPKAPCECVQLVLPIC
jgi:hypothetical protein